MPAITPCVRRRGGDQSCPGSPEAPAVVELEAPLGHRVLLDGGETPPTPATTSPGG